MPQSQDIYLAKFSIRQTIIIYQQWHHTDLKIFLKHMLLSEIMYDPTTIRHAHTKKECFDWWDNAADDIHMAISIYQIIANLSKKYVSQFQAPFRGSEKKLRKRKFPREPWKSHVSWKGVPIKTGNNGGLSAQQHRRQ
ncbi:unnamed protein product [Ixodes pacificus]